MKILVIIVTFNGIRWIRKCLSSVKEYDTFVIDNGSTDGTQQLIQSEFPNVLFQQNEKNIGFGMANNIGMKYAITNGYDYVYLMNQDAWVLPNTIETLVKTSAKHPEFGILSPMQMQDGLNHFDSIFGMKVLTWESSKQLMEDWFHSRKGDLYEVPFVMAAHWLITSQCIKRVGIFSPSFPHYGEDDNYIDRARFHGFKTGIVPAAKAVHDRVEYNEWSKPKQIYINNYIIPLKKLSNINNSENPWLVILKNAFTYPFLFKSLKPIGYLFRLLKEYPTIKRNRELSKQQGMFLNTCA